MLNTCINAFKLLAFVLIVMIIYAIPAFIDSL